jgi:molybdenum cofactor cytidylyltransferase
VVGPRTLAARSGSRGFVEEEADGDEVVPIDTAIAIAIATATSTSGTRRPVTAVPSSVVSAARVVAVVLAAGEGSRFENATHKLRAGCGATTVVERSVTSAVDSAIGPVVVVVGAVDLSDLLGGLLRGVAIDNGVELVDNPDWRDGQATSLRVGIERADALGAEAAVVGLADQPGVPAEAWRLVASSEIAPIVAADFAGTRRPPVRLARAVWPLLPTSGDDGARELMRRRPDLVGEVACPGDPADIDTVEDLRRWS